MNKEYVSIGKIISWLFALVFGEVIVFLLEDKGIFGEAAVSIMEKPIKNAYIIAVILFIAFTIFFLVSCFRKKISKYKENEKEMTIKTKELEKEKIIILKYKELLKKFNDEQIKDEGNKLFNIAMALDTFEPSKMKLMAEAAEKHHNLYAGIYLGNLYHSGLFNGDVEIVAKEYDKAYYYYKMVSDYDYTGIALWRIGWMYENGQIFTEMPSIERKKIAKEYFERAKEMNFVKAYNSLGKFYRDGEVVEKNLNEAVYLFREATKRGDTFSILNEAYIHASNPESFDLAVKCFEESIKNKIPLAYLKFGEFIESSVERFTDSKYNYDLFSAFDMYLTATRISNGTIAARAYYSIGKLLSSEPSTIIKRRKEINELFGSAPVDVVQASYEKSVEIFERCMKRKVILSVTDEGIYNKLKSSTLLK